MIKMNLQMPAVLANPKIKISRIIKNIYLIPGFFSPHTSLDIVSVGVCVSRANDWSRLSNNNVNSILNLTYKCMGWCPFNKRPFIIPSYSSCKYVESQD